MAEFVFVLGKSQYTDTRARNTDAQARIGPSLFLVSVLESQVLSAARKMKAWSLAVLVASSEGFRALSKDKVVPSAATPIADEMAPFVFNNNDSDVETSGQEVLTDLAPALDTNIQSCRCRYSRYTYQVMPISQAGNGCVGGCGGDEFQINRNGGTLKQLDVWTASRDKHSHIKAIRFTYNDNYRVVKGNPVGGGGPVSITFKPGEHVVGDVALSGNGRGSRLGSIKFSTSQGQIFDVGMRNPYRYLFPSGDSFIAGALGRAGRDLDMLGFVFWKPITEVSYESIRYPTLSSLTRIRSPVNIETRTYCNNLPFPMKVAREEVSRTVTVGFNSCLKTANSLQFGQKVTVKGSIPLVATVSSEAKWEVSSSKEMSNCKSYSEVKSRKLLFGDFSIPATSSLDMMWNQWSGKLNALPFIAELVIKLNDGSTWRRSERGTYKGVSYTDIKQEFDNYNGSVTGCR